MFFCERINYKTKMKYQAKRKAIILLADGTIFFGKSVGDKEGTAFGEVCFNTTKRYLRTLLILDK